MAALNSKTKIGVKRLKAWAIGFNSKWVEIRTSISQPLPVTTSVKVPSKVQAYRVDGARYWKPSEVELKQTVWRGGKVVCMYPSSRFYSLVGKRPSKGTITEITRAQLADIKQEKGL